MTTIQLNYGSATLLKSVLAVPDACPTVKGKFAAGQLLCGKLDGIPAPPDPAIKEWLTTSCELELTDAQREASRAAVEYAITKGLVSAGPYLSLLIEQLGLAE